MIYGRIEKGTYILRYENIEVCGKELKEVFKILMLILDKSNL